MKKPEARRRFRQRRDEWFNSCDVEQEQQGFARQILPLLEKQSGVWAAYRSFGSELNPEIAVNSTPWLTWAYPRIQGEDLEFYIPQSAEDFVENGWQVKEPIPQRSQRVDVDQISGFLIPGVAFDQRGKRIGQGKGYYDRALKGVNTLRVGVAYEVQISEEDLPHEDHDVPMDFVVTNASVREIS